MTPIQLNIIDGCYRPAHFPWYLQPFPLWTSFIIVPLFSIISSLANLQPFNKQLPIMVVISCCSYAANKVANHYIFNRSDVVSAIGAFTVGLLGNIYSRKMGGTAFTAMVTGVLFLVPVRVFFCYAFCRYAKPVFSQACLPLAELRPMAMESILEER